jgi:hypothetical protein
MRVRDLIRFLLVGAAIVAATMTPARATIIAASYAITGSSFVGSVPSPFATVVENIRFTFDDASTQFSNTSGITLISGTVVPTSTLGFTYLAGVNAGFVGGLAATVNTSDPSSIDFAIALNDLSGTPTISSFTFSDGQGHVFSASTDSVAPYVAATAVPEPAISLLFATGLISVALLRRRKIADRDDRRMRTASE